MEQLCSNIPHLIKSGRQVPTQEALESKKVFVFYFSAHWCPPCRQFTPLLAQAYRQSRQPSSGGCVEVIFVSRDRSEAEMTSYMRDSHADWLAIPYNSPGVQALVTHFGVRGIPALKVVGKDGSVISEEGRQEVMSLGTI